MLRDDGFNGVCRMVFSDKMPHGSKPNRPRLLVVDDQQVNIQILHEILHRDNDVFFATSGVQALEMCRINQPDLILLDMKMPDMDGLEVCRLLKSDPEMTGIPVVFVTAQNHPEDEVRCLEAGAVDFITKPVNPAVVRARVHTHLSMKNHTLFEQQREETARIRALVEQQERSRLSRDLHDGVGQTLQAIRLQLKLMERRNITDIPAAEELADITRELDAAAGELREIAHALRPAYLSEVTLAKALQQRCKRLQQRGVPISYDLPEELPALPHEINDNLFRIAQEALANAVRHANAGEIQLSLHLTGNTLCLCIRDDGSGMKDAAACEGKGLEIIRERAALIGATCGITSDSAGTIITVEVPAS